MAPARHSLSPRRTFAAPLALALATGLLAGCGSSSHSSSPPKPRSVATPPSSSGTGGATKQITRDWTTFFNGSTPTATRVALLQNGRQFQQALSSQSSSPLAQQASARVHGVTL